MWNGKSSHEFEPSGAARAGGGAGRTGETEAAERAAVRVAVARHEFGGAGGSADTRATGLPRGDARDHLDLFVGPIGAVAGDPDARVALTWRLPLAAWGAEGLACGRFAATPLEPHRAAYLSLATARELAGGRGRVVPLARGDGTLEGMTVEVGSATEGAALDTAAGDRPVAPPLRVVALGRRIEIRDGFAVIAAIEPDPPAAQRGLGIADDPPPASKESP
jgi:hypothetical protein